MSNDDAPSEIHFALPGASGRMGRMIAKAIMEEKNSNIKITAATGRAGSSAIGADIGKLSGHDATGVIISDNAEDLFALAPSHAPQNVHRVIVDFTTPDSSVAHAMMAAAHGTAIVIGTTGLTENHIKALEKAAAHTAIVYCANTSIGAVMLEKLVEDAVRCLDSGWDIEIAETHHKHKVDAPSGTAIALGQAAARGRGVQLGDVTAPLRDGNTGARKDGDIGFSVMRGGDIIGEHSVILYGQSERVEITHRAMDRMVFARGAIRAGIWATTAKTGLYSMKDVLA